ncbi:MAG TPA: transposase [Ktedonobacteraceae bacterium]|nr:transposase [Ktedonobacteraceae bacterium]
MPTSVNTLLRLVKREALPETEVPKAIGVDDFALRRGKTYGTMVVDLFTDRPFALLKDRTAQTLTRWLETHPGVEFMSRDRSSESMREPIQAQGYCDLCNTRKPTSTIQYNDIWRADILRRVMERMWSKMISN